MQTPNLELIIAQRELEVRNGREFYIRGLVSLLTYMSKSYKGESIDSATLKDVCFNSPLYEEIYLRYVAIHGEPAVIPIEFDGRPTIVCFFPVTDIRSIAVSILRELNIPI